MSGPEEYNLEVDDPLRLSSTWYEPFTAQERWLAYHSIKLDQDLADVVGQVLDAGVAPLGKETCSSLDRGDLVSRLAECAVEKTIDMLTPRERYEVVAYRNEPRFIGRVLTPRLLQVVDGTFDYAMWDEQLGGQLGGRSVTGLVARIGWEVPDLQSLSVVRLWARRFVDATPRLRDVQRQVVSLVYRLEGQTLYLPPDIAGQIPLTQPQRVLRNALTDLCTPPLEDT